MNETLLRNYVLTTALPEDAATVAALAPHAYWKDGDYQTLVRLPATDPVVVAWIAYATAAAALKTASAPVAADWAAKSAAARTAHNSYQQARSTWIAAQATS